MPQKAEDLGGFHVDVFSGDDIDYQNWESPSDQEGTGWSENEDYGTGDADPSSAGEEDSWYQEPEGTDTQRYDVPSETDDSWGIDDYIWEDRTEVSGGTDSSPFTSSSGSPDIDYSGEDYSQTLFEEGEGWSGQQSPGVQDDYPQTYVQSDTQSYSPSYSQPYVQAYSQSSAPAREEISGSETVPVTDYNPEGAAATVASGSQEAADSMGAAVSDVPSAAAVPSGSTFSAASVISGAAVPAGSAAHSAAAIPSVSIFPMYPTITPVLTLSFHPSPSPAPFPEPQPSISPAAEPSFPPISPSASPAVDTAAYEIPSMTLQYFDPIQKSSLSPVREASCTIRLETQPLSIHIGGGRQFTVLSLRINGKERPWHWEENFIVPEIEEETENEPEDESEAELNRTQSHIGTSVISLAGIVEGGALCFYSCQV